MLSKIYLICSVFYLISLRIFEQTSYTESRNTIAVLRPEFRSEYLPKRNYGLTHLVIKLSFCLTLCDYSS